MSTTLQQDLSSGNSIEPTATFASPSDQTYGVTTVTGTVVPTQPAACSIAPLNETFYSPDIVHSVYLEPVNDQTYGYLKKCCKGAPIVLYLGGCAAYCTASDIFSLREMRNCLKPNDDDVLPGINSFGDLIAASDVDVPIIRSTTTTSTSTPTSTPTTTKSGPSNGAAVYKPSHSILVTMAVGALAFGWITNAVA